MSMKNGGIIKMGNQNYLLIKQGNGYLKRILFKANVQSVRSLRYCDDILGAIDTGAYTSLISPKLFNLLVESNSDCERFSISICNTFIVQINLTQYSMLDEHEDIDIILGTNFLLTVADFSLIKLKNNDVFLYMNFSSNHLIHNIDFSNYFDLSETQERIKQIGRIK